MPESREIYKTLDLALRVGELLLSSGAGAADVSATMLSVARACGLRGVTADVTFTALSMSFQSSMDEPAMIQMRQVTHREIDYEDLTQVDHLVRGLVAGRIDRDEARSHLARIVSSGHPMPRWAATLGFGATGGGVGMLLGGDWIVTMIAAVAAIGVDLLQREMSRRRLPGFYQQVAGGLLATLVAVATAATDVQVDPSRVVTAGIIMLLAGVGFMGAVQDALTGFPLTAGARILEAMLATAGVIAGVSGGLTVGRMVGVDLGHLNPGAAQWADLPWMAAGAAVCAGAFAFSCYAPPRAVLPIAMIGGTAQAMYYLAQDRDLGQAWASAIAAVMIGVVSYSVAGRVKVPPLVIVVPAIVPLLPGLSIYRGLSLMAEGRNGVLSIASAAAIAIALASGVILGEYVAQPLRREARRLENRLAGPRLVGPLRPRTVKRSRTRPTHALGAGRSRRGQRKISTGTQRDLNGR
jgi:uncharacterized membrane protein YjjP (DUF1212 family)